MRILRISSLLGTGLALLFALALSPLGLAQSPAGIPPLKLSDTKLANGLRVIIAEDHSAPVFGIAITYNVGSRN